jgi:hypothetical protein
MKVSIINTLSVKKTAFAKTPRVLWGAIPNWRTPKTKGICRETETRKI